MDEQNEDVDLDTEFTKRRPGKPTISIVGGVKPVRATKSSRMSYGP